MTETIELKASAREKVGKGAARALRARKQVPAVIYGGKQKPLPIAIDFNEINHHIYAGGFLTKIVTINVDGKKIRTLPKDYQLDVVRDKPVHVDFLRVARDARVEVSVPVHFINEEDAPGIKRGGVLNVVRYEIEVSAPVESIPEYIEVDLTGLELGDSLHISAVPLPEGVTPTITDRDFTIATIAAPAGLRSEEDEAAAAEEEAPDEVPATRQGEEEEDED